MMGVILDQESIISSDDDDAEIMESEDDFDYNSGCANSGEEPVFNNVMQ